MKGIQRENILIGFYDGLRIRYLNCLVNLIEVLSKVELHQVDNLGMSKKMKRFVVVELRLTMILVAS